MTHAQPATAARLDPTMETLEATLRYARERDYTGWDYSDGTSSRILRALPVDNRWLNLAFQETAKRAPVNVRPLLAVEQRQSFKGSALFALANLRAYRLTGEERYREEAESLVEFLLSASADGYAGFCGGHQHDIQDLSSSTPAGTPSVVSTSYATRALLRASDAGLDSTYAETARTAGTFVLEDLGLEECEAGARMNYRPTEESGYYTLNSNALGARLLLDLYDRFGDAELRRRATAVLDYVVANQADCGGWEYRDPPEASHLSMDNFHNGFIIESLLRHREVTGSDRFADALDRGVSFYRGTLFTPEGAPNWDESSAYPRDSHAAGQGIYLFARLGEVEFARRVVDWTMENLHAGDGRFYYQQRRWYTKRFTLMRWCQAWMAHALSQYLVARRGPRVETASAARE
jgi:hypothetical protein